MNRVFRESLVSEQSDVLLHFNYPSWIVFGVNVFGTLATGQRG